MTNRRSRIALASTVASFVLCALSALALAQPNVECKKTETQAECHVRLKCAADEELDQCQKRLLKCTANESLDTCKKRVRSGSQNTGGGRDDRGGGPDDRNGGRDDRGGGPDDRDGERGDRGRDRGDRGGRGDDDRRSRRQRNRGRDGGRRRDAGKGYASIKTFGLGLELGEPSGLNGKYFFSDSRALDFGAGEIYHHYYYGDGIQLYVDHLWHPASLASTPTLELPFYIGVGARYWDFEYCERIGGVDVCDRGSAIGLRVPVGLSFDFNNAPIDIFVQLVPVVDLLFGDYYNRFNDRGHVGIDGSAGIRFWFK